MFIRFTLDRGENATTSFPFDFSEVEDPKAALDKELARVIGFMQRRGETRVEVERWGDGPGWILREIYKARDEEQIIVCRPLEED